MQKTKDLYNDLAWKCYQNKLNFEYNCTLNKVLIGSPDYKLIADGNMNELNEMHIEIDGYLEIEQMEDEEFITEANTND